MRVAVIGATGTIGRAVAEALSGAHEVLRVGNTSGEYQVDIASPDSIRRLFEETGSVDAVVCCAGSARFRPLAELTDEDFRFSLGHKLTGQVNLVRLGIPHVREGGSFTLTSGVLASEPTPGSAAISVVNAGVEAFARAAALELPGRRRVNVVSPPWVSETLESMGRDGSGGLPASSVARAYVHSLTGTENGVVFDARRIA
ncbi:MAG TPA: short chain dehydrogenase [Longimicrobiaceae bacterium]|nr:short chain dehydrogenase [Longimicrobiaceae bacterium]